RFVCGWMLFTFGPGAALSERLTRDLNPLTRVIISLGVGSVGVPVLIDLLGRAQLIPAFPYVAGALAGGGAVALWSSREAGSTRAVAWADAAACAALVILAAGLGAIVFWHRLAFTNG